MKLIEFRKYFSTFFFLLFAFLNTKSYAQIIYKDLGNALLTPGGNFLYVDLTGDGANDIALEVSYNAQGAFLSILQPTMGRVGARDIEVLVDDNLVRKLPANYFVDGNIGIFASGSLSNCTACIRNRYDWVGGATEAYIAFRFTNIATQSVHYAWIQLSVNSIFSEFRIIAAAYETQANTGLLTGFIPATSLNIYPENGNTVINTDDGQLRIIANLLPTNATMQDLLWSVDNAALARINQQGVLTALANGNVLIKAQTQDGTNLSDTLRVYISNQIVPVSSITVSGRNNINRITNLNGTLAMQAIIAPSFATNQQVMWSVEDKNLAHIDNNGMLTALNNGIVKVIATAMDGSRISGFTEVEISGQPNYTTQILVQGGHEITTPYGTLQLTAAISPFQNQNTTPIHWSIDNNEIASITATGLLRAYKDGSVTVSAKALDGSEVQGSYTIQISNQWKRVENLSIRGFNNINEISLDKGILQMEAIFVPSNPSNNNVYWSVDNENIAKISPDGRLQALTNGTVRVRAITQDGSNITAYKDIQIRNQYEYVRTIAVVGDNQSTSITVPNGMLQMRAILTPNTANNQQVFWKVNDNSKAYINQNGLLTALADGVVTVFAITQDGSGLYDSLFITISNQGAVIQRLELTTANNLSAISTPNGRVQITPVFTPSNVVNRQLIWTVDNDANAIVDQNGVLTALRNGSVTVRATTQDGSGVFGAKSFAITGQIALMSNMTIQSSRDRISSPKDTLQLMAQYLPANATNPRPLWRSNAPHIATIDANGILTAVGNGTVTISAIAQDGSTLLASKNFTISNQTIGINHIEVLSRANAITVAQDTMQMRVTFAPNTPTYNAIFWRVDDSSKAYITPNGLLYAKANGTVTVEALAKDNSNIVGRKTINISNQKIYVNSIQLTARTNQLSIKGDTLQIQLQWQPTSATTANFMWRSSDEHIATVNNTGLVTAHRDGVVTITAAAYDGSGAAANYVITVSNQHKYITALTNTTTANSINTPNGILQMRVGHQPSAYAAPVIHWAVNDTNLAYITPNGKLHAKADGVVQVRALAMDGSQEQILIPITIQNQTIIARDLQLIAPSNTINIDKGTLQYQINTLPSNVTLQEFAWSLSNPNIAKITQNGLLIALSNGVVTVQCKTLDGSNIIKSHTVTISNQREITTAISLNTSANSNHITIPNGTLQMLANTNGNPNLIHWSVDNPNVATISPTGLLKAKSNGNVTVMAKALDGSNVLSTYSVVVSNQPIAVQYIQLSSSTGAFNANADGVPLQLYASVLPVNATNSAVTWSVRAGTGWATINSSGLLQPIHNGTVFVRATSVENPEIYKEEMLSIAFQRTSAPDMQTLNLSAASSFISLDKGILQIFANYSPLQARKDLVWDVVPVQLATINQDGLLKAIENGSVTVTAYSLANPNVRATYTVNISGQNNPISAFSIRGQNNIQSITTLNGTLQMEITNLLPINAIPPFIKWTVDNNALATIDDNGLLRAFANGIVRVSAYALDGSGLQSNIDITITNQYTPVTSIMANIATLNLTVEEQNFILSPSVLPANATYRQLRYVSGNTDLLRINSQGVVQALKNGSTQIFIYSEDFGNLMATINVNIVRQNLLTTGMSITASSNVITEDKGILALQLSHQNTPILNTVLWQSMDTSRAIVSKDGIVTALRNGRVEIVAYAQDKSNKVASYIINISGQKVPITAIDIQGADHITQTWQPMRYTLAFTPNSNISNQIAWSVNDTALAIISTNGILIPKRNGTVIITAKTQDASAVLATKSVTLSNQHILLSAIRSNMGAAININTAYGSAQALSTFLPNNATNTQLYYFIEDSTIANVSAYGLVTAIKNGNTKLFIYSADESNAKIEIPVNVTGQYPLVTSVQLQPTNSTITVPNGALQMTATVAPQQAPWLVLAWTVSPANLATITPDGLLLAKGNGTVTVTARAQDGSNISQSTTVTISNQFTRASSITLDAGNRTINTPNGTLAIQAIVAPTTASSVNVGWSVSDASIARINTAGLLTAISNGVVTVTARTLDGSNLVNSLQITVTNQTANAATLSIAAANGNNTIATPYGKLQLFPTFMPAMPSNINICWTSSDTTVAIVNHEGWVTARKNGTVIITGTSLDGNFIRAHREITITGQPELVARLQLSDASNTLQLRTPYDVRNINLQIWNSTASNAQVRWYTDSPTKVSISQAGQLRAWQDGTVKIYALAIDGSQVKDSLTFQIANQNIYMQALQLTSTTGINRIDTDAGTLQLSATLLPAICTNPHLHWSVDNEYLAHISPTGLLTAKRNGMVLVRVRSQDASNVFAELLIEISNQRTNNNIPVEAIDVTAQNSITTITAPLQRVQLYANVFPQQALNQQVKWSVSSTYYGEISQDGLFSAYRDGTVYVFATSQDGSNVSGIYALELSNQPNYPVSVEAVLNKDISQIQIYPNPFVDYIDINLFLERGMTFNLYISDMQGRVWMQKNIAAAEGQHLERLYLNQLDKATVYVLYLQEASGAMHVLKIIKAAE